VRLEDDHEGVDIVLAHRILATGVVRFELRGSGIVCGGTKEDTMGVGERFELNDLPRLEISQGRYLRTRSGQHDAV